MVYTWALKGYLFITLRSKYVPQGYVEFGKFPTRSPTRVLGSDSTPFIETQSVSDIWTCTCGGLWDKVHGNFQKWGGTNVDPPNSSALRIRTPAKKTPDDVDKLRYTLRTK